MDAGFLLLRLVVGFTIAAHGPAKLWSRFGAGPDKTGDAFEHLGFRPGRRHAILAGITELASGLLLILGLLTPLGAAMVASLMLVAAVSVHARNGFFITTGGFEYNMVLGAAALSLAFIGPGALSLDHLFGFTLSGAAWGAGALAVAGGGALLQLSGRRQETASA
jgi:putative oxidoreductase